MSFRLRGKSLFMTYSQCSGTKEELLEFLSTKVAIDRYIIAKELHQDGGAHFHVLLKMKKSIDVKNSRFFDWNGFHPNFEVTKSEMRVMKYCTKEGDYISNMKFDTFERCRELAKAGEIKSALQTLIEEQPKEIVNLDRWKKNFELIAVLFQETKRQPKRNYKFHHLAGIEGWFRRSQTLILSGASGTGKTQYSKTLFKNPLIVRHIDKLKQFSWKNDGIIFDDMNFAHWPRESCIHLLDLDEDSDINVKCSMITIPAGTPRVITTNLEANEIFASFDKAIRRRIYVVEVVTDIRDITFCNVNEGNIYPTNPTNPTIIKEFVEDDVSEFSESS